jgi:hypothetical protein
MDFLDPHKRRVRHIELLTGYVLIAILLGLGTIVLLYLAYGFGLSKNGQVIQNGLVFVSSTPSGANIYVSNVQKGTTNARLILPGGQYLMKLQRSGYKDWSRAFNVDGGSVQHFDYPFLIPSTLVTKTTASYASRPNLVLQSPDRRWLLVEKPDVFGTFDEYDLNNPKVAPIQLTIPTGILTDPTTGTQTLTLVKWSTDNQHVILSHNTPSGLEYILFNRQTPASSINLTTALATNPSAIDFWDNQYKQYYLYNSSTQILSTATLSAPTPKTIVSGVIAYKTYGSSIVVYATSDNTPAGEVAIRLRDGTKTYNIGYLTAGSTYLLNLAQYSGNWFLAMGASNENKVYVYENPEQNLQSQPSTPLVPVNILKVVQPTYVEFSADTRMLLAEGANQFSVYDALNDKSYTYEVKNPLDPPQIHAVWMNGEQLNLISSGKLIMFDYDGSNQQTLNVSDPNIGSFYDQQYKYDYSVAPNSGSDATTQPYILTNTALRAPRDL